MNAIKSLIVWINVGAEAKQMAIQKKKWFQIRFKISSTRVEEILQNSERAEMKELGFLHQHLCLWKWTRTTYSLSPSVPLAATNLYSFPKMVATLEHSSGNMH